MMLPLRELQLAEHSSLELVARILAGGIASRKATVDDLTATGYHRQLLRLIPENV